MEYEEFLKELRLARLTTRDFAERACVPLPTVVGWGARRKGRAGRAVPGWVQPFLRLQQEVDELRSALKVLLKQSIE